MDGQFEDNKIIANEEYKKLHDEIENLEDGIDLSESSSSSQSLGYDIQQIRNISSQLSMNRHIMNRHMVNNEAQPDNNK